MSQTTYAAEPRSLPRAETGLGLLTAILFAICAVRVIGLAASNAELYFDEAQYWVWAQEPAFGYFTKPPLIARPPLRREPKLAPLRAIGPAVSGFAIPPARGK